MNLQPLKNYFFLPCFFDPCVVIVTAFGCRWWCRPRFSIVLYVDLSGGAFLRQVRNHTYKL